MSGEEPEYKKGRFDTDDIDLYGDIIGEIEEGEINEAVEEMEKQMKKSKKLKKDTSFYKEENYLPYTQSKNIDFYNESSSQSISSSNEVYFYNDNNEICDFDRHRKCPFSGDRLNSRNVFNKNLNYDSKNLHSSNTNFYNKNSKNEKKNDINKNHEKKIEDLNIEPKKPETIQISEDTNEDDTNDENQNSPTAHSIFSKGNFDFHVVDDLEEEANDGGDDDASQSQVWNKNEYGDEEEEEEEEEDIAQEEIDAMLDEGMPKMAQCKQAKATVNAKLLLPFEDEDFVLPKICDKVLLIEKGKNLFEILPEGWLVVTHVSGMPIYLHKDTRVCTLSRPYFLGAGSARKHNIPISSIPCLQYKRALEQPDDNDRNNTNDNNGNNNNNNATFSVESNSSNTNLNDMTKDNDSNSNLDINDNNNINNNIGDNNNKNNNDNNAKDELSSGVKVQSAEEQLKINSLDPLAFREYCQKLFQFRTITIRRFKRWKDRRKHNKILKNADRPSLAPSTKLITCQVQNDKSHHNKKKEFVLNPAGKSAVCILHEYAQHAIKVQPKYKFVELENSQMPYSATVIINDISYGTGYASSKKLAKLEAAKVTLKILIPEIYKGGDGEKNNNKAPTDYDFFDEVKIEDPRLLDICTTAGHPTPFQLLNECLQRNFGLGDTKVKMMIKPVKHQKSEFIMTVGKHEAKVLCRNKREGKQAASQAILQMLHPHITNWGSLLRLYSKSNEVQEKREEEHSVTELQTKAEPNKAILNKLRFEMNKLYELKKSFLGNRTEKFQLSGHQIRSAELSGVDL